MRHVYIMGFSTYVLVPHFMGPEWGQRRICTVIWDIFGYCVSNIAKKGFHYVPGIKLITIFLSQYHTNQALKNNLSGKSTNLKYIYLTSKTLKGQKHINTSTTFCFSHRYISIYPKKCFWLQYMHRKCSPFNRLCWYPTGKFCDVYVNALDKLSLKTTSYEDIIFRLCGT